MCDWIRRMPLGAVGSDQMSLALLMSYRIRAWARSSTPVHNRYYVNAYRPPVAQLSIDVWGAVCSHLNTEDLFSLLKAAPYNNVRTAVYYRAGECIQACRSWSFDSGNLESRNSTLTFDARCYWHELYLFLHHGSKALPNFWIRSMNKHLSTPPVLLEWCRLSVSQLEWCPPVLALPVARVLLAIIDSGARLQDFPCERWIPP